MTGLKTKAESVSDWIDRGAIVLWNLRPSPFLDPESGKTFAALLLSQFLDAAMRNAGKPKKHFLYLDEAQAYLTNDAAQMLDQTLKTGLRVTIAHHHMGQFYRDPHLQHSIETNARIKYVFGGLPVEEAMRYAVEFFLQELNKRWLKETKYRYVTEHKKEKFVTTTNSAGYSETYSESDSSGLVGEMETSTRGSNSGGGFSSSNSTTKSTRYVPYNRKERDGQDDWPREEKISKLAHRLTSLQPRHCYLKLPGKEASAFEVPFVKRYLLNPARVLEYEKHLQSTAIPSDEADQILKDQDRTFLERSQDYGSRGGSRPKKKSATLHPQE
jgi:hypothetical protein